MYVVTSIYYGVFAVLCLSLLLSGMWSPYFCGTLNSEVRKFRTRLRPLKNLNSNSGTCVRNNDLRENLNSSNRRCTTVYKRNFQVEFSLKRKTLTLDSGPKPRLRGTATPCPWLSFMFAFAVLTILFVFQRINSFGCNDMLCWSKFI